jgi:hypothetical protein
LVWSSLLLLLLLLTVSAVEAVVCDTASVGGGRVSIPLVYPNVNYLLL